MKFDKYVMVTTLVLLVGVFFFGAQWYRNKEKVEVTSNAAKNEMLLVRSYSPTLGPSDAKVTIVEFFDPECEACSAFYPQVKKVLKEFDGQVRLVMRYMPFHKNSVYAASVLESAKKQGKYWEALELMFLRQSEWASHHAPKPELLVNYMKSLSLDMVDFNNSLQDPEVKSKIQQDEQDGTQLGVKATPTFYVNGEPLVQLGYQELRSLVEAAIKN